MIRKVGREILRGGGRGKGRKVGMGRVKREDQGQEEEAPKSKLIIMRGRRGGRRGGDINSGRGKRVRYVTEEEERVEAEKEAVAEEEEEEEEEKEEEEEMPEERQEEKVMFFYASRGSA